MNNGDLRRKVRLTGPSLVIDDYLLGVSAVSADGYESPIVFPGVASGFFAEPAAAAY